MPVSQNEHETNQNEYTKSKNFFSRWSGCQWGYQLVEMWAGMLGHVKTRISFVDSYIEYTHIHIINLRLLTVLVGAPVGLLVGV